MTKAAGPRKGWGWSATKRVRPGRGNGRALEVRDLQPWFTRWQVHKDDRVAGCPGWLSRLGEVSPKRAEKGYGASFTPDVLWREARWVAEIKYGTKNEPLAVSEVLHHAFVLGQHHPGRRWTAVVVSQPSPWITAAVSWLCPRGKQFPALRHVECDLVGPQAKRTLWLSNPHATLKVEAPPRDTFGDSLRVGWGEGTWRKRNEEDTWVWTKGEQRLPFLTGPVAVISRIAGGSEEWIGWSGRMPSLGRRGTVGRFRIFQRGGQGELQVPK